jgi:putative Holliday junction resolvase
VSVKHLTTKKLQEHDGNGQFVASGRLLALDLGARRVGVAVSDEMRLTVRPLPAITRGSWKKLVANVSQIVREFDAKELVLGLPLRLDGTQGDAALEVRRLARNFELTLKCPVRLQDERLTTRAAEETLRDEQVSDEERAGRLDSEAAAIILRDFISSQALRESELTTPVDDHSSASAENEISSLPEMH